MSAHDRAFVVRDVTPAMNLSKHLLCILSVTALFALGLVWPFLPGRYDALAFGLSAMVQVFGFAGLLLVPVRVVWWGCDYRKGLRRRRNFPARELSHASWILIWSPDDLARQQGWFTAHDAAQPHWKQFWFD